MVLFGRQSRPHFVSTTMPPLPNELWWCIIAHAVSDGGDLAIVIPPSERLHPFFPGAFSGFSDTNFYSTQLATWKRSNTIALNLMQVSRLWRGLAEPLLYSALYVDHEWRVQMFIKNVEEVPKLAEHLRTLVIMPRFPIKDVTEPFCYGFIVQVLNLCHGASAVAMGSYVLSTPISLLQSLGSSPRLRLLSMVHLRDEEFPTFVVNFNNYATLQVLELSVKDVEDSMLPSLPERILFPLLRTLILGRLCPPALSVVGKWILPSLKELSISHWDPLISSALIPLIRRSYKRLEFLTANMDLFHDCALYDMTREPVSHLRNLTLSIAISAHLSPPMHSAVKSVFSHVVTLGTIKIGMIKPADKAEWLRLLSDSTYMPHLRSVLTDATTRLLEICITRGHPLLDLLCSFEEVLGARGVAFKGMTNDILSFIPIRSLQTNALKVRMPPFIHFLPRDSSPYSSSVSQFSHGESGIGNHQELNKR